MMIPKRFFFLLLSLTLASVVSCEKSLEPDDPVTTEAPLEDRLEISFDETRTDAEITSFIHTPYHSIFNKLLEEKGYIVWIEDAVHYKALDQATGKIGHMTLIPCSNPGDNSRIAMIKYFRGDDVYAVTAAEYFESEEYEIAHPLEERAALSMFGDDVTDTFKYDLIERSERSARYWQCVGKRFTAGCVGCATVCYITGPAWGPCTLKCCIGSAVVAMVACAFTVYLGW
jgi:hypothetical protein